jgi:hypothetical protein
MRRLFVLLFILGASTLIQAQTPTAPSALACTNGSGNTINLSWTDNSSTETGFEVDRKLGTSGTYSQITTTASNAVSYADSDAALVANRPYIYRIRATNGSGDSANTSEVSCTTPFTGTVNNYKTDTANYAETPTTMPLPLAGGKFYDETFGTQIMRFTDASDGDCFGTVYAYWATFNSDNTRLYVFGPCANTYYTATFNPTTFTRTSGLTALAAAPASIFANYESATWSRTDPDKLYIAIDMKLYYYKPSTDSYVLIKNLSSSFPAGWYLNQMSVSDDGDRFAASTKNGLSVDQGFMVYDLSADSVILDVRNTDINECQIDGTGQYVIYYPYTDPNNYIYNIDAATTETLVSDTSTGVPDYKPGHGDIVTNAVWGDDPWNGGISWRLMSTPHTITLPWTYAPYWIAYHGSGLSADERYGMISTYGDLYVSADPAKFRREIFQIGLTSSVAGRMRRLVHTRSNWSLQGVRTIVGATNASPISVTTALPHGYYTGQQVTITNVGGNTATNGSNRTITVTGANTFTIDGSSGNGTFTFGGQATLTTSNTITNCTNASPIVCTTSGPHGLMTGQKPQITGVGGNTAANGSNRAITSLTSTTFSIDGTTGNGAYTSGGSIYVELYWDSPRANISKNGRYIAWTSNWNGQQGGGRTDLFIAQIVPTAPAGKVSGGTRANGGTRTH